MEIDSEDLSVYIARYRDKLAELHLDYFGRTSKREIEVFTDKGVIVGDFINKKISFSDGRAMIDFTKTNVDMYIEEMKCFLHGVVNSSIGQNDIIHASRVLNLTAGRV